MDELDERLQSMATEKEEIMKQATTAEKHNAQMEEDLSNASTQLEVSVCVCVFVHSDVILTCEMSIIVLLLTIAVLNVHVCGHVYMHTCVIGLSNVRTWMHVHGL